MERKIQPAGFSAGAGYRNDGEPAVVIMLPPSAFIETSRGPVPGMALLPPQARELAYALLIIAEQIASQSIELPRFGGHEGPCRPITADDITVEPE